ncbi:MAG: hypothetical protein FI736_01310 [SAR202 cluster bacterium]|nr:hypothetical protein [SAR202 cluster bacterium]|tara:strand:+ start:948 stop:2195 length:1248 start_codon:yes stop_codon:yes gene_type:complete
MNKKNNISIIGAGISGIATAVSLIKKGYCVDVFESKKNLGGRAGSFIKDGKLLDIGQHVFLPSYKNFINLLKELGCYEDLEIANKLRIPIIDNNQIYYIKSNFPIYPINLIFSILGYKNVKVTDRLRIIFGLIKLYLEKDSDLIFNKWLEKNFQNHETIKKFWEIICISAVNAKLNEVTTRQVSKLFKIMIFDYKKGIGISYFKKPFSEIIEKKFIKFLKRNNSNLIIGENIKTINKSKRGYIIESQRKKYEYEKIIIATNLDSAIKLGVIDNKKTIISTNAIINIHFWFNKKVMNEKYIAFSNSKIEWIFSEKINKKEYKVIVSLSAVGDLIKRNNNEISSIYEKLVREALNIPKTTKTLDFLIVRSPKATQKTFIDIKNKHNLYFAGDWTINDLPNTMETAVLSSKKIVSKFF